MRKELEAVRESSDMLGRDAAETLLQLVAQAEVLAKQFDAVVANPPYMGGKGMNADLKAWAKKTFPASKSDLFAMFIERGFGWCNPAGFNSMVTMHSWMFLSSFDVFRDKVLSDYGLWALTHLPYDGKGPTAMGLNFGVDAAIFNKSRIPDLKAYFDCFRYFELDQRGLPLRYPSCNERNLWAKPDDFGKIPGSPVAYWVSDIVRSAFTDFPNLSTLSTSSNGVQTGNNERFVRLWHEVETSKLGLEWKTYNKGGPFRKWYGNLDHVVFWKNQGEAIKAQKLSLIHI